MTEAVVLGFPSPERLRGAGGSRDVCAGSGHGVRMGGGIPPDGREGTLTSLAFEEGGYYPPVQLAETNRIIYTFKFGLVPCE